MLPVNPGEVIDELHRVVVVRVGAFRVIAESGEVLNADRRNTPGDWRAAFQARDAKFGHDVALECEFASRRVEEPRIAEPEFVYVEGENVRTLDPMYCSTFVSTWNPFSFRPSLS